MMKSNDISKNEPIYLDQEGYNLHLEAIQNLKVNLSRINKKISTIAITKENKEEYGELITMKCSLEERIRLMNETTNHIIIVKKQQSDDILDINDTIKIKLIYSQFDEEDTICTLVGKNDAYEDGEVSINSPIGKALYKSKIGDVVYYNLRETKVKVEILEKVYVKKLVK